MPGFSAENLLQILQQWHNEFAHIGGAVILQRHRHGTRDAGRQVGGARNGQCLVSNQDLLAIFRLLLVFYQQDSCLKHFACHQISCFCVDCVIFICKNCDVVNFVVKYRTLRHPQMPIAGP
jgi:hypothetical protein